MQFSTTALFAFLASVACAIPTEEVTEKINLFNGVDVSSVTVGEHSLSDGLEARVNYCSGSSRCTNKQGFKNQCLSAYYRLEQTTYKNSGAKSGVCYGNCGLFVKGKGCTASFDDMVNAYHSIRENGCETCGWINKPNARGCVIKVDFVTGC